MELIRGDTYCANVQVLTRAGQPIDLTGKTVFFTARLLTDTPATSQTDDSTAAIFIHRSSHHDPTNGMTEIVLTSSNTNIEPGNYHFDAEYSDGGAPIPVVLSSDIVEFSIKADLTRSN